MGKDLVNELFKFINSDTNVSFEKLKEATDSAYANVDSENEQILKEHNELISDTQLFTRMPQQYRTLSLATALAEWKLIAKDTAFLKQHVNESVPQGWEGAVKAMKQYKQIANPYALSSAMADKGYTPHLTAEGTLVRDPSQVNNPEQQIRTLSEEKEEASIKTANAGTTVEPEKGKLQKEMDKTTPNVDKLSDFKVAAKVEKAKKEEPKITGVTNDSDKNMTKDPKNNEGKVKDTVNKAGIPEGKLVADPSQVNNPEQQIRTLAEEKALVTVSDENVAKGIAQKYPGGRVVPDPTKKQFVVMVTDESRLQEETTSGPTEEEVKAEKTPFIKSHDNQEDGKAIAAPGDKSPIKEETTSAPSASDVKAVEVPYTSTTGNSSTLTTVSKTDPKEPSIKSAEANVGKYDEDSVVGDKGKSTGKQDAPVHDPTAAAGVKDQNASKERHDATQKPLQAHSGPKGENTTDPGKPEVKDVNPVAGTNADKTDKLSPESKQAVKEEVEVTVKSTDGSANVSITPPVTAEPALPAAPAEEAEFTEEQADEMAERVFLSDYLMGLGNNTKLTERQKTFITETRGKKMSDKNKNKVEKKLQAMKDKKGKK